MKKLWLLLLLCPAIIRAETFFSVDYQPGIYSNRTWQMSLYSDEVARIHLEGRIGYSLSPIGGIYNPSRYTVSNQYLSLYSKETLDYISRVSYFGYGYSNRTDIKYYMAAQELIWNAVSRWNIYWSTTKGDFYNKINVDSYKEEILQSIGEYELEPSFSKMSIKENYGTLTVLKDENHVLSNYKIASSGRNEAWIEGDQLYIRVLSNDPIQLIRKIDGEEFKLFSYSSNHQDIIFCKSPEPIQVTLQVEAIVLDKIPIRIFCKDRYGRGIRNHLFQVYDLIHHQFISDGEKTIFETDDSGVYQSSFSLFPGRYQIRNMDLHYYTNTSTTFEIKSFELTQNIYPVEHLLEEKNGGIRLKLQKRILKYENNQVSYQLIPVVNPSSIVALDDIYTRSGILQYEKGTEIELMSENGILYHNDLPYGKYRWQNYEFEIGENDMDLIIERVIEYPKTNIKVEGEGSFYSIINQEPIVEEGEEIPAHTVLFQSDHFGNFDSYYLPNGLYELVIGTQRFSFLVEEQSHEFTFTLKSENHLEEIPLPNTSMGMNYGILSVLLILVAIYAKVILY